MQMEPIAFIHNDYTSKFGVPRQPGLVDKAISRIVFTEKYRDEAALRGITDFSHLWLIWLFDRVKESDSFAPTVRPPRLGGNTRMGVFATRSPFRPNRMGLSVVKLLGTEKTAEEGTVLLVSGADMCDGTPILDVKPYIPYADCIPDALGGFTDTTQKRQVEVTCDEALLSRMKAESREALLQLLHEDPRPAYQSDEGRVYGFSFARCEVKFSVTGGVLTVHDILPESEAAK